MTESELLDRTRTLVQQARLPTTFGLGESWIIILATSPSLPPIAAERYQATLTELKTMYPDDVLDFSHGHRMKTSRYLLLRAGSLAVSHWLSRMN